jgi:hypothetical protein
MASCTKRNAPSQNNISTPGDSNIKEIFFAAKMKHGHTDNHFSNWNQKCTVHTP